MTVVAGSLLATQELMEDCCSRKNCFELYGADFMLTPDLKVQYSRRIKLNRLPK
jgi:hypothetical protein